MSGAVQASDTDDHGGEGELDELELRILAFESRGEARAGTKAAAIREEFGFAPARYYRMLSAVIDAPAALRYDPLLVRRLQRVRESRVATRASRTFRPDTQDVTL